MAFDTDGSGDIDASELKAALKYLGMDATAEQARAVLSRYDTNKADARLDLAEFAKLVADVRAYKSGSPTRTATGGSRAGGGHRAPIDENIRIAFARFDADGNGRIDAQELRLALKQLGVEADGAHDMAWHHIASRGVASRHRLGQTTNTSYHHRCGCGQGATPLRHRQLGRNRAS